MAPEPEPAQESVETLMDHLEDEPEAHDVREHNYTVDFTIGNHDLWPKYFRDDELNVIRSSSISFGGLRPHREGKAVQGNPQTGSNIHLPPAREELYDEIEEAADFPEHFSLVNGTFQLGGITPPPTGVCTPHLIITEDAPIEVVIEALDEAFDLYRDVYDGGDAVIKRRPDETSDE